MGQPQAEQHEHHQQQVGREAASPAEEPRGRPRSEDAREKPGLVTGVFLIGYACARIFCEFFREPDAFLGFLWFGATMGQLLSIPVFLLGAWLTWRAKPEK